jgi:hypothetical protein
MHRDAILPRLKASLATEDKCIGQIFEDHGAFIKMYSVYVNNFDAALGELEKLMKRKKFKQFCLVRYVLWV